MAEFRLKNRNWYPWLFAALVVLASSVSYLVFPNAPNAETTFLALGGVGGLVGFLYSQHLQQTHLFKELFIAFNKRYDALNDELNSILARSDRANLSDTQRNRLCDYFNLCSEEFLFFKAGYIDAEVWRAWCSGMKLFCEDPEIAKLWASELKTGSYYGFTLAEISRASR